VNAAPSGRRAPCTIADARARLDDAEAFLEAAELATNSDVIATNAVHAAIAAVDAICCVALRERAADANHAAAVELLGRVDRTLAATFSRVLNRKAQAAYESRDIGAKDAAVCVRQATALVVAARSRVRRT
jgi:hypothetical protein